MTAKSLNTQVKSLKFFERMEEYGRKKKEKLKKAILREHLKTQFDPKTGQRLFNPQINRKCSVASRVSSSLANFSKKDISRKNRVEKDRKRGKMFNKSMRRSLDVPSNRSKQSDQFNKVKKLNNLRDLSDLRNQKIDEEKFILEQEHETDFGFKPSIQLNSSLNL